LNLSLRYWIENTLQPGANSRRTASKGQPA
jgi:hypothetical protein